MNCEKSVNRFGNKYLIDRLDKHVTIKVVSRSLLLIVVIRITCCCSQSDTTDAQLSYTYYCKCFWFCGKICYKLEDMKLHKLASNLFVTISQMLIVIVFTGQYKLLTFNEN